MLACEVDSRHRVTGHPTERLLSDPCCRYTKQIKGIRPDPRLPGFFTQPVEIPGCSNKVPPAIIDSVYSAWWGVQ